MISSFGSECRGIDREKVFATTSLASNGYWVSCLEALQQVGVFEAFLFKLLLRPWTGADLGKRVPSFRVSEYPFHPERARKDVACRHGQHSKDDVPCCILIFFMRSPVVVAAGKSF